jgi:DNA-directed RNA polymerase specialized sigma24 family protein
MRESPSRSGTVLHGFQREQREKINPPTKTNPARFDSLVARYYPAIYNFASRLTDDPREAILLTRAAFLSVQKQVWRPRDEIALVRILLKAVVRTGLTTA